MNNPLTLGSLFSGSGGFELGGLLCGVQPIWASEIEPFPIRVTTKRMPWLQHLGDINRINGAAVPPVDIITGGFCCQDLSVAGKRAGLHGERSGLFFQIIRIIKEMRAATNNAYPTFAVLENVPGMYSSRGGEDFLEVLNELAKIKDETLSIPMPADGKWSTAGEAVGDGFSLGWRTLDAQFWGVAQRRRRCYIVVDFAGERAGKILFDETRLRGNPPQSDFAGQATAAGAAAGVRGAIGFLPGVTKRLGRPPSVEISPTILAQSSGDNRAAVAFGIGSYDSNAMKSANPHAGIYEASTTRTLDCNGGNPACNQGGMAVVAFAQNQRCEVRDLHDCAGALAAQPGANQQTYIATTNFSNNSVVAIEGNGARPSHLGKGYSENGVSFSLNTIKQHGVAYGIGNGQANQPITPEQAGTLNCMHDQQAVCIDCRNHRISNISGTLQAKSNGGQSLNYTNPVADPPRYIVRRLTPQECALLQGFPVEWCAGLETPDPSEEDIAFWAQVFETQRRIVGKSTKPKSRAQIIKWLQNPHSDAKEYAMWGNGVALPCVVFVLQGIVDSTQL